MKCFLPSQKFDSIFDIPLRELIASGIKGLIFDLDNTLTEWNKELSSETTAWLKDAKNIGFKLCFVSNNSDIRVREVADVVDVPFVARAGKPLRRSFRKAMGLMRTTTDTTAVVGDQIFTDIWGGNRLGLLTILVSPISSKEFLGTRVVRLLENILLKWSSRRSEQDGSCDS